MALRINKVQTKQPLLAVNIICRDERDNIAECLESVLPIADEIIVVDTGSVDDTVVRVQGYVDMYSRVKLYHFAWCDDFSAARNEALSHTTARYVLWLDADERIMTYDHALLREALESEYDPLFGFLLLQSLNPDGTTEETMQMRIFPNIPNLKWTRRVHEQIYKFGLYKTKLIEASVYHYGYQDQQENTRHHLRNLPLLEQELAEKPDDFNMALLLAISCLHLKYTDKAEEILERLAKRCPIPETILHKDAQVRPFLLLAAIHRERGELMRCYQYLDAALAIAPNDPFALYSKAELLFAERRYEESFAIDRVLYTMVGNWPHCLLPVPRDVISRNVTQRLTILQNAMEKKDMISLTETLKDTEQFTPQERHWLHEPFVGFGMEFHLVRDGYIAVRPKGLRQWGTFVWNFDIFINRLPLIKLILGMNAAITYLMIRMI